jgi:transcription-repair coupling factor (superfamily II helicase)
VTRAAWSALPESGALPEVRERLASGRAVSLSGLQGTARLLYPLLASERPLLVVVPREREVEPAVEDLRTLAGLLEQQGQVLGVPSPGPAPFRGLPRHPDACLRRAAALHAAHRRRLRAVVASPAGLLRPVLRRESFEIAVLELAAGEEMTPEMLLEALDEALYRREDPVTSPGEVARRGGILDIFPPDAELPVRLEFLGDTIESMRSFDPDTQRSVEPRERVELLPLSDVFATRTLLQALRPLLESRFREARALPGLLERLDRVAPPEELPELLGMIPGALVPVWAHFEGFLPVVLDTEAILAEAEGYVERAGEDRSTRGGEIAPELDEALVSPGQVRALLDGAPGLALREVDPDPRPDELRIRSRPAPRYAGDLRRLAADLGHASRTLILLGNPGRADRLRDVLEEEGLAVAARAPVEVEVGALSAGFELPDAGLTLLADGDVFPEEVHLHRARPRRGRFLSDFRDLDVGDYVVHEDHGIGRFEGLETLELHGSAREFMVLSYRGGDKLKVPIESFDRVQKYLASEGPRPAVDRLGSGSWDKVKRRVKKAMREMAGELLKLYAERKSRPGHAFAGESPWQREFDASFEFEETPDQAAAIVDVSGDMQKPEPMDRLICGDVGYGKTEVAMRAAMRAVLDGKQVAVLTPTTVLAFQHWSSFRKRFAPFPVSVEMVSRFRPAREAKQVLEGLAAGRVDILIGTHRLLSKDVVFRDLGLLVIDEEQRFGVSAKERLKQLRTSVDCLTLSATPIPRTLQMGLAGIRDMSVIETPPKDRLAIQTSIVRFSTELISTAIRQELAREGQVFVVHNRVASIDALAAMIQREVPEARVVVAHGQMPEAQLERHMMSFVEGRTDVLVSTTIIENGLDIPRANTIVVNRADRYGLAQLYQLRGRVGRSDRRAHAYLLIPPDTVLSEIAQKRLAAIRDFSDLGAGFRIAALDLELRGAGNLLGGQQSGHILAVGLDTYVKLLEQTIQELRGEEVVPEQARTAINLRVELRIPDDYVPDLHQRLALYKRVSQLQAPPELEALRGEVRDRFGPPPPAVHRLLDFAALRLRAGALGITQVDRSRGGLQLHLGRPLPPEHLVRCVEAQPGSRLTPEGLLAIPVPAGTDPLDALQRLLGELESAGAASEAGL